MNQNLQLPDQPTKDNSDVSDESVTVTSVQPQDSYIKLAMRNMVRKSGTSLRHFALTFIGLLAALVGLAYLFR